MTTALVTLIGRKSLTIYHENVEERFRQNISRTITKKTLIDYCMGAQRGMFSIEIQDAEAKQPPPPASPSLAASEPEPTGLDADEEQEEDSTRDTDPPPRKPPRKRVKV